MPRKGRVGAILNKSFLSEGESGEAERESEASTCVSLSFSSLFISEYYHSAVCYLSQHIFLVSAAAEDLLSIRPDLRMI